MSDIRELEELQSYRRKIFDGAQNNIHEGISRLTDIISMLNDFQEICTTLFHVVEEQQSQIKIIQNDNNVLKSKIQEKIEYINRIKEKEAEYKRLELNSVKVASLMSEIEKKSSDLKQQKVKLENEKAEFEKMKSELVAAKNEAEQRVEKLKSEKDNSVIARDKAIAEKRQIEEKLNLKKSEIEEKNKKIDELNQKLDKSEIYLERLTNEKSNLSKQIAEDMELSENQEKTQKKRDIESSESKVVPKEIDDKDDQIL